MVASTRSDRRIERTIVPGEEMAGPDITEFHKQFRVHMNDDHDLARHFFHQVNYLGTYLEYAGIPYAMSYFFEEPGYSQTRRRVVTPHWPQRSNDPMMQVFGTPDPKYLHRFNILPGAHWHALQVLQRARKETLYASNRHPNQLGHELIAQRLFIEFHSLFPFHRFVKDCSFMLH